MILSLESKLTLAELLIAHGYNKFEGIKLKCAKPEINDYYDCKVRRTCKAIEAEFLEDPYYTNNHPELFV